MKTAVLACVVVAARGLVLPRGVTTPRAVLPRPLCDGDGRAGHEARRRPQRGGKAEDRTATEQRRHLFQRGVFFRAVLTRHRCNAMTLTLG